MAEDPRSKKHEYDGTVPPKTSSDNHSSYIGDPGQKRYKKQLDDIFAPPTPKKK